MSVDLDSFYKHQSAPPSRYGGQLSPEFQDELAGHYAAGAADCVFTHTMQLPAGTVQHGAWDLRGSEADLLGHVSLQGKRVLEFLPGSGWLTAFIARSAAETVCLDLAPGLESQMSPSFRPSTEDATALAASAEPLRRSWWFTRQAFGTEAKLVYADLHQPPDDLGMFDVSVMAGTLFRLPHPLLALQSAARHTREAIVVTEPLTPVVNQADTASPTAAFAPAKPGSDANPWWQLSPAAVCRMLLTVGFEEFDLTVHTPKAASLPLFTVVARRRT